VTSPVKDIEYRYFLSVNDKQIFEEWEKNHQVFFIGQADQYTLYDYWQVRPANLAFYSSAFTKSLFAHPCNTHERVVKSGKTYDQDLCSACRKEPARGYHRKSGLFGQLAS
jgi:4-alpha-glucanotransferase